MTKVTVKNGIVIAKSEEFGEMIACDSITCSIEWFHVKCLHLLKIPKGKWYCPDCQKSRDRNKRLRRK